MYIRSTYESSFPEHRTQRTRCGRGRGGPTREVGSRQHAYRLRAFAIDTSAHGPKVSNRCIPGVGNERGCHRAAEKESHMPRAREQRGCLAIPASRY